LSSSNLSKTLAILSGDG